MSTCNHCLLIRYKKEAAEKRCRIVTVPSSFMGGMLVFRLAAGEKMQDYTEPNEKLPNGCKWYATHIVSWMMKIPKNCRCS